MKFYGYKEEQFDADMRGCSKNGIVRRNGFLYLADSNSFVLRVPGDERDIKYIAPEELAAGMLVIIKQNITVDKDGLYRALVNQLGFSRMGDAIYEKLDEALNSIKSRIINDNGSISLRN